MPIEQATNFLYRLEIKNFPELQQDLIEKLQPLTQKEKVSSFYSTIPISHIVNSEIINKLKTLNCSNEEVQIQLLCFIGYFIESNVPQEIKHSIKSALKSASKIADENVLFTRLVERKNECTLTNGAVLRFINTCLAQNDDNEDWDVVDEKDLLALQKTCTMP